MFLEANILYLLWKKNQEPGLCQHSVPIQSFQNRQTLEQFFEPLYQFRALVATSPPALQCLPVQHLFTDISLSFALKIMFLQLFESFLVVLSYSGGDVSLPALCGYWSACLKMPASATSIHWYLPQFCFKNYLFKLLWKLSSRAIICQSNLSVLLNRSFKSYPPSTLGIPWIHILQHTV